MQKRYVEQEQTISDDELLELISVGRSLPGTMIGNVSLLYGYHAAGVLGGLACVLGMFLPPLFVLMAVTGFYTLIQDNYWVTAVMTGVRASIVPIIASAAIRFLKGAFTYKSCIPIAAAAAVLYLFFNTSSIWLVILGGICGVIISEYKERKGGAL